VQLLLDLSKIIISPGSETAEDDELNKTSKGCSRSDKLAMKVTNNTQYTSNTKPIYPNLDQSQTQDSTKRKPNPHLDAVAAMPAEPTLRLRGGGADAKRKEARKRKFAQTEPRVSSTTNPEQQSESAGAEKTDPNVSKQQTKKRKRTHAKDPSTTNNVDSKAAPTNPEADDTEAPVDGAVPDAATAEAKPQRFIVFIGPSPPSPLSLSTYIPI
jgi:preprotein translocase subunit SecD